MPGFEWLSFFGGFITAVGSKFFINWYSIPKLKITNIFPVTSRAELPFLQMEGGETVQAFETVNLHIYRIKIINEGRSAAKNVCGTIEFIENKNERRICWYEGNVSSITLNREDHSFLDVYGVIMEGNNFTNKICIPTENGWIGLNKITINTDLLANLRVTAENAKVKRKKFKIDSQNNCELKLI